MKVLVVDDDTIQRMLLVDLLQRFEKVDIVEADSGDAAWKLLQEGLCPVLCCCDMRMPGLSGMELLQHFKSRAVLAEVPFVFITASTDRNTIGDAIALGAANYILKPFDLTKARSSLEKIFRSIRERYCEEPAETKRRRIRMTLTTPPPRQSSPRPGPPAPDPFTLPGSHGLPTGPVAISTLPVSALDYLSLDRSAGRTSCGQSRPSEYWSPRSGRSPYWVTTSCRQSCKGTNTARHSISGASGVGLSPPLPRLCCGAKRRRAPGCPKVHHRGLALRFRQPGRVRAARQRRARCARSATTQRAPGHRKPGARRVQPAGTSNDSFLRCQGTSGEHSKPANFLPLRWRRGSSPSIESDWLQRKRT